jgi:pimeloyl-ACP methyl ester carboxylesterase
MTAENREENVEAVKIPVLPGIREEWVETARLRMHVLSRGKKGEPVIFLHGNVSSATFWEEVMLTLPKQYRCIAPDMRGYGLTEAKPVDATRGVRDWTDDLHALVEVLGLESFHLVGWSLGGGWAMQYLIDHPERVLSLTLVAPVSPYGYGGTRDEEGTPCWPDYAGSGAGGVNPEFPKFLLEKNRESGDNPLLPRNVMNSSYWKPPFRPKREEDFLMSVLSTAVGEENYPGDTLPSSNWPGFAPGTKGVLNSISPKYFNVSGIVDVEPKPPILWVRGVDDHIISDASLWDAGFLGKIGAIPDWPGEEVFPPQPMIRQTRAVLERYKAEGGAYTEVVFDNCGHSPHIEKHDRFCNVLLEFLRAVH